ncbi:MAG: radical SAM protein [Nitrospirae bacterium]|nr:radical SAM protein [Nitrospirota bacterium]
MNSISYLRKKKGNIKKAVIVYPFTYINPYYALPPIAAEYLQAGIVETGRDAVLLDMRYETNIGEHLKDADLVCLYGYFEDCSIFGKWKIHIIPEVLNQIPSGIPIIAGGTGFSNPGQAMEQYPQIDIIIRGNPETPIMELLNAGSPENIKNLVYRMGDKVIYTERVIHNLPENIYPRRNLRNPKYQYHMVGLKVDLIRAGVGCNYRCKFCFQYGKDFDGKFMRWYGRTANSLFNELKETEAPFVGWIDDDMTTDMRTLEELSDLLLKNKIQKLFMGTGRLDHVLKSSVDALKKMERAGFLALSFGIESLKKDTLRFYGKGLTIENIEKGMKMMQKTNILLICNFIFGSPGETEKDMMEMLWFGRKWNADTIVTNRFRVQKDSPMYNLIYDPETGKIRHGMERIEGPALDKIKYKIKFAQRTPFRILLTFLKLYRHKGMFIEPLYIFCSAFESITKYTWLKKTKVFPFLLKLTKRLLLFPIVRHTTRTMAVLLTPIVKAINLVFEFVDKKLGISTAILPKIFLYFKDGMYKKHSIKAQIAKKEGL